MLEVINLHKTYEGQPLLKGISFSLAAGETLCLLGASGSGKSTILRIIAGLEQAESGEVRWDGQNFADVPVHQRNFGLMFQDYALFPHLNVFENVAFGLRRQGRADFQSALRLMEQKWLGAASRAEFNSALYPEGQKWPEKAIKERVASSLELVKMMGFENRRITDLSGGEQQRVALARALAPRPRLLMLDEPLGALDRALRETLMDELRNILHHTGIPAIYVTHDQEEAFTIADKIILLHEGQVAQAGTAPEVFAKPANGWVASFLGLGNVAEGQVVQVAGQKSKVKSPIGEFWLDCGHEHRLGETVTLLLRPQARLVKAGDVSGKAADVVFRGEQFRVELENGLYFYLNEEVGVGEVVNLNILRLECL